uniref:Transposase n=2 Tax=Panagrellus redivivus TaxID=6233 RepID=A0A7E4VZ93_PANRE
MSSSSSVAIANGAREFHRCEDWLSWVKEGKTTSPEGHFRKVMMVAHGNGPHRTSVVGCYHLDLAVGKLTKDRRGTISRLLRRGPPQSIEPAVVVTVLVAPSTGALLAGCPLPPKTTMNTDANGRKGDQQPRRQEGGGCEDTTKPSATIHRISRAFTSPTALMRV